MSTQVKVAAIAIALATGLFVAWPDRPEPAQVAAASAEVTAPEQAVLAATELREAEEAQPARQVAVVERAAEPTAAPAKTPAPAAREVTPLQGRVFGADASPLSGVALEFRSSAPGEGAPEDDAPRAVSRAGGRFVLEDVRGSGQIVAASDEYLTIYAGQASAARQDAEVIVVVAPRLELAGRVIDEAGRPIEGARLHVQLPTGFRGRFAHVMDYSTELPFRTSSDSAGRFALPAPLLDGASFVASSEGYETHHAPAPERTDEGMVVVLGRPGVGQGTLSGLVVDAQGHPVPEARVAYGLAATETDQDGVFSFEMDAEDSPNRLAERFIGTPARRLLAFKRGYLPASLRLELEGSAREVRWPDGIVLRLGESPLSLAGRVVAPDGRPLEGLQVWIADATVFSLDRERGAQVVENLLAATPAESPWRSVETSADGSFELDGLLDREYTVSVMDPATLVRVDSDPVPAGSEGVTITFDSEGLLERVAGRVVDRRGNPIAGISVFPMNDAFRLRYEGHVLSTSHGGVEGTITDAEGRFSLEDVAESLVYLRLNGEDTISVEYGRGVEGGLGSLSGGKLEELEIVVPLRVHVQVELEDPTEADSVAVLDEAGEEIVINVIQGTRRQETPRVPLEDGRSDVLTVTDSAATLVLYSGEERVREVPLELTRGELNSIRP